MEIGVPGSLMGLPTGISVSFSPFSSRSSGQLQQSGRAASGKIRPMGLDLRPKCLWNINRGQRSIYRGTAFDIICRSGSSHSFCVWETCTARCISQATPLRIKDPKEWSLSCFMKALASRVGDESQEGLRMYFQETFHAGTHSVSGASSCLFWEVFSLWIVLKRKLHTWHLLPAVSGAVSVLTPPCC